MSLREETVLILYKHIPYEIMQLGNYYIYHLRQQKNSISLFLA